MNPIIVFLLLALIGAVLAGWIGVGIVALAYVSYVVGCFRGVQAALTHKPKTGGK